ncbi:hypothetical protein [Paenibacillus senegalensis]|uniref:hypothetical protein n=1 Tax=Paenibacillus senegalensis TaxID=1465766 RepID=UPI0002EE8F3C|nr:hypothetical protein [Paenibacillus senegalensis]
MASKSKQKINSTIVLQTLMDESAFPWMADWYRSKVQNVLGDKLDDRFRLWYVDRSLHADTSSNDPLDDLHIVSYIPALFQALRDVSAWVEKDVAPPASTCYEVADGQVIVPDKADQRRGIQPLIRLTRTGANALRSPPARACSSGRRSKCRRKQGRLRPRAGISMERANSQRRPRSTLLV